MDGVACALEWSRDEQEVTYWRVTSADWHRLNPVLPRPDADLVATDCGLPLWPATTAGGRLRTAYREHGDRALVAS